MKTMKIVLLLLISCNFLPQGHSQSYHHFPNGTAIWTSGGHNMFSNIDCRFRYGMYGDTIIGAEHYKKIYSLYDSTLISPHSTYYAALREDTNKRVYCILPGYPEFVLYDFSLNVGDTLWLPLNGALCGNGFTFMVDNHYKIVTAIDSVQLLNNEYRKRWHLSGSMNDIWIEGVGTVDWFALFNPIIGDLTLCGDSYYYVCFKENDTTLFLNNSFCNWCFCELLTPAEEISASDRIIVFPNPAMNKVSISINEINSLPDIPCEIYDIHGQLIFEKVLKQEISEIDLAAMKKGMYFLKLQSGGQTVVKKIILE